MSLTVNPTQWSNNTKKNYATAGTIVAGIAGYNVLSKATKGKSYQWNNTINKSLRTFVKSSKEFFGSGALKNIAGKLSKTSAREKILTAFVIGAIGAGVAIREHFAKKQGAEAKQAEFNENIKNYDSLINLQSRKIDELKTAIEYKDCQIKNREDYINKQNQKLADLEADNMIKDSDIKGLNKAIETVDKAAEKLGVDKALAEEIAKTEG